MFLGATFVDIGLAAAAAATVLVQMLRPALVAVPVATLLAFAASAAWSLALRRADGAREGAFFATLGNAAFRWYFGIFCPLPKVRSQTSKLCR